MRSAACFAFTAAAAGCGEAQAAQLAHAQKNTRVFFEGGTETELLGARSESEERGGSRRVESSSAGRRLQLQKPPKNNPGNLETL